MLSRICGGGLYSYGQNHGASVRVKCGTDNFSLTLIYKCVLDNDLDHLDERGQIPYALPRSDVVHEANWWVPPEWLSGV